MDGEILTEEQVQKLKDEALLYLNDIKGPLEDTMTRTTFEVIFSGSAVERFGIPLMMTGNRSEAFLFTDALHTDLDVMFSSSVDKASFTGDGNILIEPLVTEDRGFTGYATLTSLTPGYEGQCVSSKLIRDQAKDAVGNASISHIPADDLCLTCWCGRTGLTPKVELDSKGPAIKINIAPLFEVDITICIKCSEWPPMSDWPSRPRYWPSVAEAQRIMSLGCHLVAKSAPEDKEETSWRFSFSMAEVELSKLVPDTARKCFLALKIILKDHLQPVVPEISSYHIKTIFFNTLEKVPVGFWVDDNIEECFLTLLAELRDALLSRNFRHHWFSSIKFNMGAKDRRRLADKVERIMKDPAPFILDDGCCLAPCCVRVPKNNFTRRSSEQFLADYDEVILTAEEHVIGATENNGRQVPVSLSLRSNSDPIQIDRSTDSIENHFPEQLVVSLPPLQNDAQERSFHQDDQLLISSTGFETEVDLSYFIENHDRGINTGPEELVVSLPPLENAAQETGILQGEAEDDWFSDTRPLLVILPRDQNA